MTDAVRTALDLHDNGFNCAQAVFAALADVREDGRAAALRTAACFGGGMRCGEVCGAVTGALMAIGLAHGHDRPDDAERKADVAARTRAFVAEFRERNGTLLCRELLGEDPSAPEAAARLREQGRFRSTCPGAIADAVDIASRSL